MKIFARIVLRKLSKNVQFSKHKLWILVDQLQLQNLHISSENMSSTLYQLQYQKQIYHEDEEEVVLKKWNP